MGELHGRLRRGIGLGAMVQQGRAWPPHLAGSSSRLIGLQQSTGNAAASNLIAEGRLDPAGLVIQRQPADPESKARYDRLTQPEYLASPEELELVKKQYKTLLGPLWESYEKAAAESMERKEVLDAVSPAIREGYKKLDPALVTALSRYSTSEFREINGLMRALAKNDLAGWNQRIKNKAVVEKFLDRTELTLNALNQMREVAGYRGPTYRYEAKWDGWDKVYKENETITMPTFMSTSRRTEPVGGIAGNDLKYTFEQTSGVDISPVSQYPHEEEVLIPLGTKFLVTSVKPGRLTEINLKQT